jgi:hypothetical protein
MRALFWIFPAILKVGKKGEMIKAVKYQLGAVASKMWKDTKLVCDTDTETISLLATMRTPALYAVISAILTLFSQECGTLSYVFGRGSNHLAIAHYHICRI